MVAGLSLAVVTRCYTLRQGTLYIASVVHTAEIGYEHTLEVNLRPIPVESVTLIRLTPRKPGIYTGLILPALN